eukprot:TRINITY_DN52420_c0_g1_i1.p2 TRINITY_DN52420_c0_g1~~TRINITY_DN52420_c0_g1_i1.p2  ORF type:complete len:335 (+),score=59.85 TRINITY_DN52420_c0_g1_i1:204-1208(+)
MASPAKKAKTSTSAATWIEENNTALTRAVESALEDPGSDPIRAVGLNLLRPDDVQPSAGWPKEMAFQLCPRARVTSFATVGPKATQMLADAKNDLEIIKAAETGFAYMVDNFETLVEKDGWLQLDVSMHPLQKDIELENVHYIQTDNADGTKDVTYISRHVCDMEWPKMMDVYWDEREKQDTAARGYVGKTRFQDEDRMIYHTWLDQNVESSWQSGGLDRKDLLQYGEKFFHTSPHGDGEVCCQFAIDMINYPEHPWVHRDNNTHMAGSAMFPHEKGDGVSNIYCVRNQTVPGDADVYECLIHPMAVATEQQIIQAAAHSDTTCATTLRCTRRI